MNEDNIMAIYSKEIKEHGKILNSEEQKKLAKSIYGNKIISKIYSKSLMDKNISKETKYRLKSQYEEIESQINKEKEVLTTTNLPLVIFKAKKYVKKGVEFSDLIQEGSIALFNQGINNYDPYHSSNSKFTSYAGLWIDQAMGRVVYNHSKTIRLPVHVNELETKIQRFTDSFILENLREPSSKEISEGIEIKLKKINETLRDQQSRKGPLSLDYSNPDNGSSLLDTISYNPEKELEGPIEFNHKNIIEELFLTARLTEREEIVMKGRFGLDTQNSITLRELGEELGVTRERIRQIEIMSINKLRNAAKNLNLNFEDLI